MKYFFIAGEASGDLHASNLMAAIRQNDPDAFFCGLGGDKMQAQGMHVVRHYRDMAYMGFVQVILHLRTILGIMRQAQLSIKEFNPDMVILVDYPSFNLKIAKWVKQNLSGVPVYYYIAPKVWAWKEWRVKQIRRYVDRVFSILPFEVDWFSARNCPVDYIGNPCVDAVQQRPFPQESFADFSARHHLPSSKPIIALLAGSRVAEVSENLPAMLQAAATFTSYQMVLAAAPSISDDLYARFCKGYDVTLVSDDTYSVLQQSRAAVVVSGTATLEAALLRIPQTVVYYVAGGKPVYFFAMKFMIHLQFISLVNLILNKEVVKELISYRFSAQSIQADLSTLLEDGPRRTQQLADYDAIISILGTEPVSARAARHILQTFRAYH